MCLSPPLLERDSHDKERAQAEKTKFWSVLGSFTGTCIGMFGLVSQNSSVEEPNEDFSIYMDFLHTYNLSLLV